MSGPLKIILYLFTNSYTGRYFSKPSGPVLSSRGGPGHLLPHLLLSGQSGPGVDWAGLMGLIIPYWINELLRLFAWQIILADSGILNHC